jgi:hypothetical protein
MTSILFGRLPKVKKANIPESIRRSFEQMGVGAVSQVVVISTITVDLGSSDESPQPYEIRRAHIPFAVNWLIEQRSIDERRQFRQEKVEAWILVLVALEALGVATDVAKTIGHWFHWG